jgi:hypothetical protein
MAFHRVTRTEEARRAREARLPRPLIVATRTELQNRCEAALQSYAELMRDGCALLAKVKQLPIPKEERDDIFSHRKLEIAAQTQYSRARKTLWDFLMDSTDLGRSSK